MGCGNDDDNSGGGANGNDVNWKNVPSQFNPDIKTESFDISGIKKVEINLFGFDREAKVIYSNDVPKNTMDLQIYTVFNKAVSWGTLYENKNNKTLNVSARGNYHCDMQVENSNITSLEGGCYVRLLILLPPNSEVEVYNVGNLLTKKFFAMSKAEFLLKIDQANFSSEKFKIMDEFISTYTELSKKPQLFTSDLQTVLEGIFPKNDQMTALKKLHSYVKDRNKLGAMIEDVFVFSSHKKKAKKIVGL